MQRDNPKLIQALKDGKAPLEHLVLSVLEGDAAVHKGGADKYGARNWLIDKIKASTYVAAILRHLLAWARGQDLDPESGYSHLYHIRACCAILLDSAEHGTLIDDRGYCESKNDAGHGEECDEADGAHTPTLAETHDIERGDAPLLLTVKSRLYEGVSLRNAARDFMYMCHGRSWIGRGWSVAVFDDGDACAIEGPFATEEEAAAWARKNPNRRPGYYGFLIP